MRPRRLRLESWGLLALGPALAACPTPTDTTPLIHVTPGAAGRLALVLGPPAPAARVHVMAKGEELAGPNAIGGPGDLILENEDAVFVIDRLGSSAGFAESGGNVVDAADAHVRSDELGQVFTYFGVFPRQGVYDSLETGAGDAGAAWVEARGHELYDTSVKVTTRYTLGATGRALHIETQLENTGATPVEIPGLGDAVQWGGAEKVAPGKVLGFKGDSHGLYVGGVGRFASYAIAPLEGDIDATSGSTWTDTTQAKAVTLAPLQTVGYARVLVVGERADTASLATDRLRAARQAVGEVIVDLRGPSGAPVEVPLDARVSVRDPATGQAALTLRAAGTPARLAGALPEGHWTLAYLGGGGRAGSTTADVNVAPGAPAHAFLTVSEPGALHVRCTSELGAPMPCKITFARTDGGPQVDFGPAYCAGAARDQVTSADGDVKVAISPGVYRVIASRGPEYTLADANVTVGPGTSADLVLTPRRVLDTTGYLGCDFHQHTMVGTDSPVSTRDRVIANAAEGVEVAVATEHNVVIDYEPIVRELGLGDEMVSLAGDELTSDASVHPWGHANAWPLPVREGVARGGAPAVRDRTPAQVFSELRAAVPWDFVIQINHPRSGKNGYFDLLDFDPAVGAGIGPGYETAFDALEVWNGRNVDARSRVLSDFFALLRTGHRVTPTADTDTHGIVGQEAGYPRTYVRVADDGHLGSWDASRSVDLVNGVKGLRDVVLTNGPMLRVSANGGPIGAVARGAAVTVRVHVESAPWVDVHEVRLVRASAVDRPEVKSVAMKPLPDGAQGADVTFVLRARGPDAFVIMASGAKPMGPVVSEGAVAAESLPWAMTGAIWADPGVGPSGSGASVAGAGAGAGGGAPSRPESPSAAPAR